METSQGTGSGKTGSTGTPATLVIGDMHLKQQDILPLVDRVIERFGVRRVVFCGDYCDDWGASDADLLDALALQADWAERQRAAGVAPAFLLGNHDWCYTEAEPAHYTRMRVLAEAAELLEQIEPQIATVVGGMLVTHAGLTSSWAAKIGLTATDADEAAASLNALSELSLGMRLLYACGRARGGYEHPGPLWADRSELVADALPGIGQIVGHTPAASVLFEESRTDDRLVFVDTFSTTSTGRPLGDGSMLLVGEGREGRSLSPVAPGDLGAAPWGSQATGPAQHRAGACGTART